MQFSSDDYYRAAIQRWNQAKKIHEGKDDYAFAMYCSGLAVECMLRAFRWKNQESFDERHDLKELLRASEFLQLIDRGRIRNPSEELASDYSQEMQAALNDVAILWHNNLRFSSEDRLDAFLKQIGKWKGIKGDVRKKNSSDLLEAATKIITTGIA